MSTQVFPSLPGQSWPVKRSPKFKTQVIESVSGKEVRIALQSSPRYLFEISFELLRSNSTTHEFEQLMAFYNTKYGSFDSWLYSDPDDRLVTGQTIGVGDGQTTAFQLIRAFGAAGSPKWIDIILAPNVVSAVYFNNGIQSNTLYSVSNWGALTPGVITFNSAPSPGVVITADFSWFWPCRFVDDTIEFSKNYQGLLSVNSIKFQSIK